MESKLHLAPVIPLEAPLNTDIPKAMRLLADEFEAEGARMVAIVRLDTDTGAVSIYGLGRGADAYRAKALLEAGVVFLTEGIREDLADL